MNLDKERQELFEKNLNLAYNFANSWYVEKTYAMDREDYEQMALLYLWEACLKYENDRGCKFSTFATTYIRNAFINYLKYANAQKRSGEYESLDDPSWLENEPKDGYDYIPDKDDKLSYQMLRWDIEMQLNKERKRIKKNHKKEKSLLTGIAIIGKILDGKSGSEIIQEFGLTTPTYHRCLKKAQMCLKHEV